MVTKFLRNIAVSILFLILLTAVGYAGMMYTVHKTFLNKEFYKEEFIKYQVHQKMSDATFSAVTSSLGKDVKLTESQIADLRPRFDAALPLEFITKKFDIFTMSALDYINGKTSDINLTIDIREKRTDIIAFLVYATPMTNSQLNNPLITPAMIEPQIASLVPESIDFFQQLGFPKDRLTELRAQVAKMNQYYMYSIIAIIVCFILIFLLLMNLKSFFKAIASNSIAAGVSFIIPALIIPNLAISLPKDIAPTVGGLLKDALQPMLVLGIILIILGIILFISSFFVPTGFVNEDDEEPVRKKKHARKKLEVEEDDEEEEEKPHKKSKN